MRPVKLTMGAFGPYAGVVEVDFDALGRSGVYLVCGDTGAGKTMIFDAICYALFGEASGDARGGARATSSLRSDYADASAETFVELEFEYRRERYRIRRSPEYQRAKKRGEGTTRQPAKAEMEFPDGHVVSRWQKVDAEVVALLGIDSGQFKQIVMLAQGEFRRLLTADTATRETIFRKLFGTEVYELLQERLADEARSLEQASAKVKAKVSALAGRASFPEGSALAGEFAQVREREGQLGPWLREALDAQIAQDAPVHARMEDEVEQLRMKWSDANTSVKQAESREALEQEKSQLSGEVASLKEQAPGLARALEEQREREPRRAQLAAAMARIEAALPKYEELHAAEERRVRAHGEAVRAQKDLEQSEATHAGLRERVGQLEADAAALSGADVAVVKAHALLDAAKRKADQSQAAVESARKLAAQRRELFAKADGAKAPHEKACAQLQAAEEAHDADLDRLRDLQKRQRAGRAGLLAADLQDGSPCPVCGSTSHPAPAAFAQEIPTDEAVDAATDAEAASKRAATELSLAAEQLKAVRDERAAALAEFDEAHGGQAGIDELVFSASADHDEALSQARHAEAEATQAEAAAGKLAQAKDQLASARKDAESVLEQLEGARAKVRDAAQADALAQAHVQQLKADLEFPTIDDARTELKRLRGEADSLAAAREAAEKAVRDNASAQELKTELLRAADRRLEALPGIDVEATKAQMASFMEKANSLKAEAALVKTRIDANQGCLRGLVDALQEAGGIEERYGRVKLLGDAATGNLVGKSKIRFEAYVQAIYFDKVIEAANQRLKLLTSGQFELIRHSEGGGKSKTGLGLYVVDSFTGRSRDASSLSGGESFQASLCLALGLSDIVQAHAGGIEFDTMFVDEGFGSLDQGALGNAISLLSDLSGGTKLVGIISHVEDLKANIPKKIFVKKDRTGSSVSMEL